MATNNRVGSKPVAWADRNTDKGSTLDTATFVGIIKNNLDPTRSGRLQIWIPDLGGDEDDSNTWRTVSYASPFFGSTYNPTSPKENSYKNSGHTYGFWAVPPDLDNHVLCTFVNGDPGCFSYDNVLRFSYDAALLIVNLFWEENKTYLGIAIIETDYPNEIDYSYVEYGKEKNMEVKMNREK
jgi:hypothetical protein